MTLRVFLAAVALAVSLGPAQAKDEALREINEGAWFGGAYKDKDGKFSHCAVTTLDVEALLEEEEEEVSLVIALTSGNEVLLSLAHEDWEIPSGDTYSIPVSVDGYDLGLFPARAGRSSVLHINTGQNTEIFDRLRQGRELVVDAARERFRFNLDGSARAMDALRDCVYARGKPEKDTNPFAGRKERGEASERPIEGKRYASGVDEMFMLWGILRLAGREDIELVEAVDSPFGEDGYGWTSGQLEGAVYASRAQDIDADRLAVSELARQERDCAGLFTSNPPTPVIIKKRKLTMFSAECRRPGEEGGFFYAGTSVDRGEVITTFISTTRTAPAELQELNQNIFGWFKRTYSE